MRRAVAIAGVLCALSGLAAVTESACTPAETAQASKVEGVVLADIVAGKSLETIEQDVAVLFAGQPGADIVAIVNDALALLIDMHVVPIANVPTALALQIRIRALPGLAR